MKIYKNVFKYFTVFLALLFSFKSFALERDFSKEIDIEIKNKKIGLIEISNKRPIDQYTFLSSKFSLEDFKKKGVSFVLLKLDTPGGEVLAASELSKLFIDFYRETKIPIIAYIDKWALSAGALLAYSCKYILINDLSLMGAAEPVYSDGKKMEKASEKINSALRGEFKNVALVYNRNPLLAEAMVDDSVFLVKRNNKIIKINESDSLRKSDEIISGKNKLLTLNANELIKFNVANDLVEKISFESNKINDKRLEKFSISTQDKNLNKFNGFPIIRYNDFKISFFNILTHPLVISILTILLLVCGYIEFSSPGFGIFGFLAISALFFILLGSFIVYTISFFEILILILGILFILLEIFVIPGFGISGVLGIIFTLLGLFLITLPNASIFLKNFNFLNLDILVPELKERLFYFLGGIFLSIIIIYFIFKFFTLKFMPRTSLVLKEDQKGYKAQDLDHTNFPEIGSEAKAYTDMRPYGKIIFKTNIYNAISKSGFINKGTFVIIDKISGSSIIVKRKK